MLPGKGMVINNTHPVSNDMAWAASSGMAAWQSAREQRSADSGALTQRNG